MSGELQSIPARHGTATFVPKGQTIKIINTYGKQVVDTWIFGLHDAPGQDDDEEMEAEEEIAKKEQESLGKEAGEEGERQEKKETTNKEGEEVADADTSTDKEKEDSTRDNEAEKAGEEKDAESGAHAEDEATESKEDTTKAKTQPKSTWSSYIPSLRRNQNQSAKDSSQQNPSKPPSSKRTWASYLPSGESYTSYLPNRGTLSAFVSTHERDPTKSYAEQLYDFSKTPVGAASLSVATGSGPASSLYAAYSAYTQTSGSRDKKPMEYLSLAHTRDASKHLVPVESDVLYSNLRAPLVTLVEDTSKAGHDALLPACDATFYTSLGVEKPAEYGSCAENLVLALNELNGRAGLKGSKAIGADVCVNSAPSPLHLFMHTSLSLDGKIEVKEPKGVKRGIVRFRAEKDVVVVMSACPCKEGPVNAGRCMAANFMVEESWTKKEGEKENEKAETPAAQAQSQSQGNAKTKTQQAKQAGPTPAHSPAPTERRRSAPKLNRTTSEQRRQSSAQEGASKPPVQRKPSAQRKPSEAPVPEEHDAKDTAKPQVQRKQSEQPQKEEKEGEQKQQRVATKPIEKRKPKKLERRKPSESAT